jgi:hypothetical protein
MDKVQRFLDKVETVTLTVEQAADLLDEVLHGVDSMPYSALSGEQQEKYLKLARRFERAVDKL